jgi:hypothetical protein
MPNSFKVSAVAGIGTSPVNAYVCPASTSTTVIGLSLSNITTSQITVNAELNINGGATARLVKDAPIPVGSSLVVVGGDQKVVLNDSDAIQITSSAVSSVDVVTSYLEIT